MQRPDDSESGFSKKLDEQIRKMTGCSLREHRKLVRRRFGLAAFWMYWNALLEHVRPRCFPMLQEQGFELKKRMLKTLFEPLGVHRHHIAGWASGTRSPEQSRFFVAAIACDVHLCDVPFSSPDQIKRDVAVEVIRAVAVHECKIDPITKLSIDTMKWCEMIRSCKDHWQLLRDIALKRAWSKASEAVIIQANTEGGLNMDHDEATSILRNWFLPYSLYRYGLDGTRLVKDS